MTEARERVGWQKPEDFVHLAMPGMTMEMCKTFGLEVEMRWVVMPLNARTKSRTIAVIRRIYDPKTGNEKRWMINRKGEWVEMKLGAHVENEEMMVLVDDRVIGGWTSEPEDEDKE